MSFMTPIDALERPYGKAQVMQAEALAGSSDAQAATQLFFLQQTGMRMKQVRITLPRGGKLRVEPGAIHHMSGRLEMRASTGGGILRGLQRTLGAGETMFVNEVTGEGEIWLEPSFGHFILMELNDIEVVVDQGMFFASLGDLDVLTERNGAVSALMGGDGWFQTRIKGSGIAVLFSPVPMSEIRQVTLHDETLQVDGNFALLRSGQITYTVEKSSRSWVSTMVSGEGLLQTFRGTGLVWLAPTKGVYERLSTPEGIASLTGVPGSRGTNTAGGVRK